ncbi:MAG TPA: choline kinase [Myxococcales bacterium]|nr:choline kinase [Deltaproteobacteria bacterium]HAA57998.1 choline kinase [Myxococcales bacterium]
MHPTLKSHILRTMRADALSIQEVIQTLWSGYGELVRVALEGGEVDTIILKHIVIPEEISHPRGWATSHSHQRKLRSYEVERAWYRVWSEHCGPDCRIPRCYGEGTLEGDAFLLLEDLDTAGFPLRKNQPSHRDVESCLSWLASFHAAFMMCQPAGLWETGTYWQLDTRPDELAAMEDKALQQAAPLIDRRLKTSSFQTIVHGDAKVANFCFGEDGAVAAVDFQYVGGGCGMKDVAYFLGSCLDEEECAVLEEDLLSFYFVSLRAALARRKKDIDVDALEEEWRGLFAWAWADFHRFLIGWMPGHWKVNAYSQHLTDRVLRALSKEEPEGELSK